MAASEGESQRLKARSEREPAENRGRASGSEAPGAVFRANEQP